jgi:hypothetical protein
MFLCWESLYGSMFRLFLYMYGSMLTINIWFDVLHMFLLCIIHDLCKRSSEYAVEYVPRQLEESKTDFRARWSTVSTQQYGSWGTQRRISGVMNGDGVLNHFIWHPTNLSCGLTSLVCVYWSGDQLWRTKQAHQYRYCWCRDVYGKILVIGWISVFGQVYPTWKLLFT